MMNKLIFARDKVLLPFSNALKIAEKAEHLDEFTALEEGLEKNLQKRQQITQLFTKGYLDCKSQYKNVGFGQYKNVGFPTFLYWLFSLHLL